MRCFWHGYTVRLPILRQMASIVHGRWLAANKTSDVISILLYSNSWISTLFIYPAFKAGRRGRVSCSFALKHFDTHLTCRRCSNKTLLQQPSTKETPVNHPMTNAVCVEKSGHQINRAGLFVIPPIVPTRFAPVVLNSISCPFRNSFIVLLVLDRARAPLLR